MMTHYHEQNGSHRHISQFLHQSRWLLGALFIGFMLWQGAGLAQAHEVYVPMIPTANAGPGGTGEVPTSCGLNEQETVISTLLVNHPDQKRIGPVCDPILAQVARARARDMAQRGYFAHVNPDGDGPNFLVSQAGYALPNWYPDDRDANNIESIAGGQATPDAAWGGWLQSDAHRMHVLGMHSFYAGQTAYGVGYFFDSNSRMKHYWVFLSAPIEEAE